MSEGHIRWVGGGEARILGLEADRVVLRSTAAHPPGSRIEGSVVMAAPASLRIKIHSCRRQLEGDFVLHGRLLDVTRADRSRLESLISSRALGAR